jgi:cobalt-zinc-cadmium efflux system membrane fusion protein
MKNSVAIIAVVVIGIALAFLIMRTDKASMSHPSHESPSASEEVVKGPHRGRLLGQDDFQVEVTIYETGVPPQFRVYPFEKGKPVDPGEVTVNIALHRFGGRVDEIRFKKEGDYLRGDKIVEELHSFDVKVAAERKGQSYQWEYSQREGRVDMAAETVKSSGIEIATAGPMQMKTVMELPGEIHLNKNKAAHIVPRLPGVITEIRKNLGDRVRKGEVIAVLDSRELAEVKGEYIESVHRMEFAQASFIREEGLWKKRISPEQDYLTSRHALEEAEIARQVTEQKLVALGVSKDELAQLAIEPEGPVIAGQVRAPFVPKTLTRYELRAPLDGTLIEKRVTVGEAIQADADIFTIADLSTVWGEITVYAKDLRAVRLGQKVTVKSKDLEREATGSVSFIGALIGEETRTASAHVDIPNPNGFWLPGLFVTVELVAEEVPVPVAVATDAIQTFRDWNVVYVQYGDQFEARPVEMGRTDGEWVEVTSGLSGGEKYAAHNSFVLKADLGKSGATHDH